MLGLEPTDWLIIFSVWEVYWWLRHTLSILDPQSLGLSTSSVEFSIIGSGERPWKGTPAWNILKPTRSTSWIWKPPLKLIVGYGWSLRLLLGRAIWCHVFGTCQETLGVSPDPSAAYRTQDVRLRAFAVSRKLPGKHRGSDPKPPHEDHIASPSCIGSHNGRARKPPAERPWFQRSTKKCGIIPKWVQ